MDLRKGLRLMSRSATHCDVVTLIAPCDGGWDVRVVWWRMTDGKWSRLDTYPRVWRTTAELATFTVARYADPNRIKP
jgi:hypothetical protein